MPGPEGAAVRVGGASGGGAEPQDQGVQFVLGGLEIVGGEPLLEITNNMNPELRESFPHEARVVSHRQAPRFGVRG